MSEIGIQFNLQPFNEVWMDVKKRWGELYSSCVDPSVFYHACFLDAAAASPIELQPSHLALGYKGDDLVFGLPVIMQQTAGSNELNFYAGPGFDHLAPLDPSNHWETSVQFFTESCRQLNFNSLKIENAGELFFKAMLDSLSGKKFFRKVFRCPYLSLSRNSEDLLSTVKKKFSYNLKRDMRRLEEIGVTFRIVSVDSGLKSLEEAFENLNKLHDERSETKDIHSKFTEGMPYTYYTNVYRASLHYPGLVKFVEVVQDSRVIASLLGYCSATTFFFHQHGFARDFSAYSLGSILIYKMMEESVKNNLTTFDFLRGADDYKFKWTSSWTTDYFLSAKTTSGGLLSVYQHQLRYYRRKYGKIRGTLMGLFGGSVK